jgi:hypothetical protein
MLTELQGIHLYASCLAVITSKQSEKISGHTLRHLKRLYCEAMLRFPICAFPSVRSRDFCSVYLKLTYNLHVNLHVPCRSTYLNFYIRITLKYIIHR